MARPRDLCSGISTSPLHYYTTPTRQPSGRPRTRGSPYLHKGRQGVPPLRGHPEQRQIILEGVLGPKLQQLLLLAGQRGGWRTLALEGTAGVPLKSASLRAREGRVRQNANGAQPVHADAMRLVRRGDPGQAGQGRQRDHHRAGVRPVTHARRGPKAPTHAVEIFMVKCSRVSF